MAATPDAVADELYALPPGDFIAARDARMAEARQSGDRPLMTAIKALRRPTTSAWLANWLVRERGTEIGRLLDFAERLREAQSQLAGDDLRQLLRQRRLVVAQLSDDARRSATEIGIRVGEGTVRELEEILDAALADEAAAATLRRGRLTGVHTLREKPPAEDLRQQRERDEDLRQKRKAGEDLRRRREAEEDLRRQREVEEDRRRQVEAADRRRQIEVAEQALSSARSEAAERQRQFEDHERFLEAAHTRLEALRQSIVEVEAKLVGMREEATAVELQVLSAQQDCDSSALAAREAADRASAEQEQLERLRP